MVAIAFLVPLGAAVRLVAADRAVSAADQEGRSLAGVLTAVNDTASVATVLSELNASGAPRVAEVWLASGEHVGPAVPVPPSELALAQQGRAFTASSRNEDRVWVPIRNADG